LQLHQRDEGIDFWIDALDAREIAAGQLGGRQRAIA